MMKRDYTPEGIDKKGPKFRLYGQEFHCAPMVSANVIIGFTSLMVPGTGDDGEQITEVGRNFTEVLAAIEQLFRAAINIPEEWAAWEEMRSSNTKIIPIQTLIEIGTDLTDHYSTDMAGEERPTTPPSGGGSAKQSRRVVSKGGASLTASAPTTYSRSEPATTGH